MAGGAASALRRLARRLPMSPAIGVGLGSIIRVIAGKRFGRKRPSASGFALLRFDNQGRDGRDGAGPAYQPGRARRARDHLRVHLAGSLKVATLRRRISAITAAHRITGLGLGGATRGPTATSGAGVRAAAIPEDGPDADALRDAWTGRPE